MPGSSISRRRDDTGAAAVEFALVAPLLLLLVFGVVQYGFMLSFRQALSQAAAEGARAAAVAPSQLTDVQVQTRAREAITDGLGGYGVTCTAAGTLVRSSTSSGTCVISTPQPCTASTVGAQCVKVTLAYAYGANPLTASLPGLGLVMPDTLTYVTEAQVS